MVDAKRLVVVLAVVTRAQPPAEPSAECTLCRALVQRSLQYFHDLSVTHGADLTEATEEMLGGLCADTAVLTKVYNEFTPAQCDARLERRRRGSSSSGARVRLAGDGRAVVLPRGRVRVLGAREEARRRPRRPRAQAAVRGRVRLSSPRRAARGGADRLRAMRATRTAAPARPSRRRSEWAGARGHAELRGRDARGRRAPAGRAGRSGAPVDRVGHARERAARPSTRPSPSRG